uniref:Uncharacterized protein n=1 Tax=Providencia alcalifaciens TaxID=126385 RepID=H7C8F8_9GAMM|nr:hypothetical protein [Providencia alcalifaciens]
MNACLQVKNSNNGERPSCRCCRRASFQHREVAIHRQCCYQ